MRLWNKYWPDAASDDRMAVAVSRALSAFAVLSGIAGVVVTLVNLRYLVDYPMFVGTGALAALIALAAPLVINGSPNFTFRARLLGYFNLSLLVGLAIANQAVASVAHLLLLPSVMAFTLVMGTRDGALAAALALFSYCLTYAMAKFGGPTPSALDTYFTGMVCSLGFVFVAGAVFRSEMLALVREAQDQRRRAEEAGQSKSRFLANMSHEVRTPLNGVLGMAELLSRSDLRPQQAQYVDVIRNSGGHLLTTLNDILDLSRVEAGRLSIDQRPFRLDEVIDQVVELHAPQAEAKGLTLTSDISAAVQIDQARIGDPTRVVQILQNLVSNAVKFTVTGSVTLSVSPGSAPDRIEIRVSDTGCGMSADELARVFKPFTQADESAERSYGGAGLGLSIVHRLVELLGGALEVDSTPDAGTVFTLELALPFDVQQDAPAAAEFVAAPRGQPLKVLVVDDNDSNRKVAAGLLQPLSADVTLAVDGQEAVEFARTMAFDLILMDIRMPRLNGADALAQIQAAGDAPPVIAMTANVMTHQVEHYRACGFAAVLAKPLSQQTVLDTVAAVLSASGAGPDQQVASAASGSG